MTDKNPAGATRSIEHLPLDELKADPKNPKAHRLDVLSESVGRFGFVEPVVVDARTGYLVSGHGRAKTLREMRDGGESPPEGIVVADDGEWLVPAATGWASRTDSEAAAVLIALNRTTEVGGWVDDELLGLLDSLSQEDEDGLLGLGYDDSAIDDLRALVAEQFGEEGEGDGSPDGNVIPDEFGAIDLDEETDYQCPSCGYGWNGQPR